MLSLSRISRSDEGANNSIEPTRALSGARGSSPAFADNMRMPDSILGRSAVTVGIAIGFAVCFSCAPHGFMLVANMLTPDAEGVLSFQVGSFLPGVHAVLVGLTVLFSSWVLIPIWSVLSAISVLLATARRSLIARAMIVILAFSSLLVGALWAPGPITRWPFSILGHHEERELVRDLFPLHIVRPEWISPVDDQFTGRWAVAEIVARCAIVALGWALGLIIIHRSTRHISAANNSVQPTAGRFAASGG
jgi:hypothetical protein